MSGITALPGTIYMPAAVGNPPPVQVYINSTRGTNIAAGTVLTLTTGATLANGYIFVDWAIFDSASGVIGTCSFNGSAMNLLVSYALVGDIKNRIQQFGLPVGSLAAGTYNITFTISGGGLIGEYGVAARALNNVHQTVSVGTAGTASSAVAQTSSSVAVISAVGELVLDTLLEGGGFVATATGTGHTERWDQGGVSQTLGAGGDMTGAILTTPTWTFVSQEWAAAAIPLKPA